MACNKRGYSPTQPPSQVSCSRNWTALRRVESSWLSRAKWACRSATLASVKKPGTYCDSIPKNSWIRSSRDHASRMQSLNTSSECDQEYLRRAIELAQKSFGLASPNPNVGAVLVEASGEVLGEGFHTYDGRKHAEVLALERAGEKAR